MSEMTFLQPVIAGLRGFFEGAPLVQFALVLALGLLAGEIVRRWLGWPVVVGYMIAGILLGPYFLSIVASGGAISIQVANADLNDLFGLGLKSRHLNRPHAIG
jgi:predicted Kef-type K+ transport protein